MGSSFTKDKNIDLYIHTNKPYYVAGDIVEGEVYLNCRAESNYSNICITIDGEEKVYWEEGSHPNVTRHWNDHKSYSGHVLLVDFHGRVQAGQYVFPFSLLLPAMMSGSFIESWWCYIKYFLRVKLVHPTQESKTQVFQMLLNILQPPRAPPSPIGLSNNVHSKCCNCCCSYGSTIASLSCDRNFVMNGDKIKVSGLVDNTQGTETIKGYNVVLEQWRVMVDGIGCTNYDLEYSHPFFASNDNIKPGQTRTLEFTGTIPNNITHYTAIGRIVARYFTLGLYTDYGCCANKANAQLHIIVQSKTPIIVEKKQLPRPPNWNPQVYPKITCQNLPPFVYSPLPEIPFLNMPGPEKFSISMDPSMDRPPSLHGQYRMLGPDFRPQFNPTQFTGLQPVYYGHNLLSEAERQQQGYNGYQPYFESNSQSATVLV